MLAALDAARPRHSVDRAAARLWYTLSVVPTSQKWVCERAKELEIETYVPVSRDPPSPNIIVRRKGAAEPIELPLMPGYVFVSLPTRAPRFDLFQPFDRESDRPEPLPIDARAGYVADYAQPRGPEPIWGCRGFLSGPDGPMPVSEAVIEDMRLRERNGEFDLTGKTENGRQFVAKWVKRGVRVQVVENCPFAYFFGKIERVKSAKLITVALMIFGRETMINMPLDFIRWAG